MAFSDTRLSRNSRGRQSNPARNTRSAIDNICPAVDEIIRRGTVIERLAIKITDFEDAKNEEDVSRFYLRVV